MGKLGCRKYKHKPTGKMIKEIKQMAPGKRIGGQMVYPMSATRPYGLFSSAVKAIGTALTSGVKAVGKSVKSVAKTTSPPTLSLRPSIIRQGSTVGPSRILPRYSNVAEPYFRGNSLPRYSGGGKGPRPSNFKPKALATVPSSARSSVYQTAPSSARSSVAASLNMPTNPRNSTISMNSTVPTNPRNSVVSLNTPTNPRNSIASISSNSLPSRISMASLASSTSSKTSKLKNFGKKIENLTSKGLLAYGVYNALEDIEKGSAPLPQETRKEQAQPTTPVDGVGYSGRQPNINNTKIINNYNGWGRGHRGGKRPSNPYQDNNSGSGFSTGGVSIAQPTQGPPGKYVENSRIYSS